MDIILNEKQYALDSIENNYLDIKKPTQTLKIIIKYYYSLGMDKEQIRNQIENFMVKNYKDFNSSNWQNILDKLVKVYASDKFKLVNVNKVNVTIDELNKIKELDNLKLEKLAFVILVYAKILNQINADNNNWVKKSKNLLAKEALIKDTGKTQKILFKKLNELGYIEYAKKINNTSVRVIYVNEKSEVIIKLTDFRDFVLEYLKWKGENISYCIECGKPIQVTNNKIKYCKECAKDINIKKTIENRKK